VRIRNLYPPPHISQLSQPILSYTLPFRFILCTRNSTCIFASMQVDASNPAQPQWHSKHSRDTGHMYSPQSQTNLLSTPVIPSSPHTPIPLVHSTTHSPATQHRMIPGRQEINSTWHMTPTPNDTASPNAHTSVSYPHTHEISWANAAATISHHTAAAISTPVPPHRPTMHHHHGSNGYLATRMPVRALHTPASPFSPIRQVSSPPTTGNASPLDNFGTMEHSPSPSPSPAPVILSRVIPFSAHESAPQLRHVHALHPHASSDGFLSSSPPAPHIYHSKSPNNNTNDHVPYRTNRIGYVVSRPDSPESDVEQNDDVSPNYSSHVHQKSHHGQVEGGRAEGESSVEFNFDSSPSHQLDMRIQDDESHSSISAHHISDKSYLNSPRDGSAPTILHLNTQYNADIEYEQDTNNNMHNRPAQSMKRSSPRDSLNQNNNDLSTSDESHSTSRKMPLPFSFLPTPLRLLCRRIRFRILELFPSSHRLNVKGNHKRSNSFIRLQQVAHRTLWQYGFIIGIISFILLFAGAYWYMFRPTVVSISSSTSTLGGYTLRSAAIPDQRDESGSEYMIEVNLDNNNKAPSAGSDASSLLLNPERLSSARRWNVHNSDNKKLIQPSAAAAAAASSNVPASGGPHGHLHLRAMAARLQAQQEAELQLAEELSHPGPKQSVVRLASIINELAIQWSAEAALRDNGERFSDGYVPPVVKTYRKGNAAAMDQSNSKSNSDDDGAVSIHADDSVPIMQQQQQFQQQQQSQQSQVPDDDETYPRMFQQSDSNQPVVAAGGAGVLPSNGNVSPQTNLLQSLQAQLLALQQLQQQAADQGIQLPPINIPDLGEVSATPTHGSDADTSIGNNNNNDNNNNDPASTRRTNNNNNNNNARPFLEMTEALLDSMHQTWEAQQAEKRAMAKKNNKILNNPTTVVGDS
jgi:type II secretory pathway pseudopilin PulG